jgi:hypothetical protein
MPRQPFLPKYKDQPFGIGLGSIDQRPELASLIGKCIAAWSNVDLQMALVLAALLRTDTDAALAVYLVLRRHASQREALESAAKSSLSGDDLDICLALLAIHKQTDGDRNALAHGIFGVMNGVPDTLLWTSTADHAYFLTEVYAKESAGEHVADRHKRLKETNVCLHKRRPRRRSDKHQFSLAVGF